MCCSKRVRLQCDADGILLFLHSFGLLLASRRREQLDGNTLNTLFSPENIDAF